MVAEQTAAYQKQLWMSQLQITNPQAYQVIRLFCSLLISFSSFRPLSHLKLSLSAFCSFPGASARRGDLGKKSFQFLHKKSRRCSALILHSFLQVFNPLFKNKNLLLQHPLSWSCFPFSPILVKFIGFDITDADELFHIVHWISFPHPPQLICSKTHNGEGRRGHLNHNFLRKKCPIMQFV